VRACVRACVCVCVCNYEFFDGFLSRLSKNREVYTATSIHESIDSGWSNDGDGQRVLALACEIHLIEPLKQEELEPPIIKLPRLSNRMTSCPHARLRHTGGIIGPEKVSFESCIPVRATPY
jgi:hypothetical protein